MASIINAATSGGLVTSADTSGVLQLQTASTTAVTVDASQNVGIGTSSPSYKLDVAGNIKATVSGGGTPLAISSGSFCGFSITGSGSDQFIAFNDGATNRAVIGVDFSNANAFVINSGGGSFGTQFVLDTSGRLSLGSTLGIGGATPSASGVGITFPPTANPSTDANTLDDYEEGTWTPSLGGNTTYNSQSGNYIKIGKMVFVEAQIFVNSIGTGSTSIVSGLPFTSATQVGARSTLSVSSFYSTANNVIFMALYLNSAATTAQFQGIAAAGTSVTTIAIFGNNTDVYFSGCYPAAN